MDFEFKDSGSNRKSERLVWAGKGGPASKQTNKQAHRLLVSRPPLGSCQPRKPHRCCCPGGVSVTVRKYPYPRQKATEGVRTVYFTFHVQASVDPVAGRSQ